MPRSICTASISCRRLSASVPVCLVAAVNDPFSGAVFPEGPQEVEGSTALSFVRQRHGLPNGDPTGCAASRHSCPAPSPRFWSVGTLTDPSKLSDLIDAANQSIVLSQGFNLLDLASQMAAISSGNINFVTLPTHGAETSTSKDALSVNVPRCRRCSPRSSRATRHWAPRSRRVPRPLPLRRWIRCRSSLMCRTAR